MAKGSNDRTSGTDDPSGWRLRYWGSPDGSTKRGASISQIPSPSEIDPVDVVQHGAVHLHALGPDGSLVHHGSSSVSMTSLDVSIVSAGLMSPFPTALTASGIPDNKSEAI